MMINFSVYGEPQGKGRAKPNYINGHVNMRTPEKTVSYENLVKTEYRLQCKNARFTDGTPIFMTIKAFYSIPKSVSKKKRAAMISGEIRPTKKPDADNVMKVVADSLNEIAYKDDAQIVGAMFQKYYGEAPRIEVRVETVKQINNTNKTEVKS